MLDLRAITSDPKVQTPRWGSSIAFAGHTLLPANEAFRDDTRKAIDRAVLCNVLGLPESTLGPLATLRLQWCAEPSVHGNKATRPSS